MRKTSPTAPRRSFRSGNHNFKRLKSAQSALDLLSKEVQPDFVVHCFKFPNAQNDLDRLMRWLQAVGFLVVATFEDENHKKNDKSSRKKDGLNLCLKVSQDLLLKIQAILEPGSNSKKIPPQQKTRLVHASVPMVLEAAKKKGIVEFGEVQFLHNKAVFEKLRANFEADGAWLWNKKIQPLAEYYGSYVAFYFSWLRFYFLALLLPAGVGALIWHPRNPDTLLVPLYVVFISLWSVAFLEGWRRESNVTAYKWNVWHCKESEKRKVIALETNELCTKFPGADERPRAFQNLKGGYGSLKVILDDSSKLFGSETEELESMSDDWMGEDAIDEEVFKVGDDLNYYDKKETTPTKVKVVSIKHGNGVPSYKVATSDGTEKVALQSELLPYAVGDELVEVVGDEASLKKADTAYNLRMAFSYFIQLIFLAVAVLVMLWFQYLENNTDKYFEDGLLRLLPNIGHSVTAILLARIHGVVAGWLNRYEAEPDDTPEELEGKLIIKLFGFQFVNYYCALFYTAFYEQNMDQLGGYLFSALVTRQLISSVRQSLIPFAMKMLKKKVLKKSYTVEMINDVDPVKEWILKTQLDDELNLQTYTSRADYLEMVIQFGYVVMFSASFKLAPLIALLNNLFEFPIDSENILHNMKRPEYLNSVGIGPWQYIMEFLGVLGVITNCGLLLLTSSSLEPYIPPLLANAGGEESKWQVGTLLFLIVLEHVLILVRVFVAVAVEDIPKDVQKKLEIERICSTKKVD